ncbi:MULTISPECIES: CusA/CzcA family heavy metal efflux RND transporter [unclassified Polynucleobacter]|uniref:efflux RND transporter permease subunit n=1 Tax=unclassified Polynucleobacter TaxID=2640945 RepID=UPI000BD8E6CB|nr:MULTISPECIES: CusA/CzcA family heavy metal efflux RND transporter [unclassified Polynucleobacter]OYY18437.1 MAG: CusA/CzcA family heavy metal efflux RND transporter [Polynucleobacter sp. 35-46-11]OZA78033.1 MAG: CusA/CzcA family heavy metal efflux RND transporter [Polynucleobacter sp. 39-46-10]
MSAFTSFIRGVLEKRVLVIVGSIVLLGLGMFSLSKLPIQPYPGVAPLTIQAISQWPGRSTTEVEQQVTIPVENALAGIPGLQAFRSVSLFGLSVVTLKFNDTTDPFKARQTFITSLANVSFPTGVSSSISPDTDATGEIMRYEVKSDYASSTQLKTLQNYEIYKELKQTPGVADVSSFGGRVRQYQVIVSPESLQSKGVTVNELIAALTNANSNTGGGLLPSGEQQFVVRGVGLLKNIDDIKRVVISIHNSVPIRIGDVAQVEIGNAPRLGMFQFNDNPDSVEGIVYLRRGENATAVLARVRSTVENINKQVLPPGIEVVPFYDRQVLLDITIGTVKHTLFFGISLVLAVLFFFLGNLRAAAVVAAVIPLALCVSFIQMHIWSVPANLISLGAIDFGVIVDSAVILTENVMRHLEEGGKRLNQSIILATSEVQRAMIYSTGIIIVAYSPLFFMGGVEGIIFKPMAFTMGFALIAAMILSLTFLPAMISLVFGENLHHKPPGFITRLLDGYKPLLRKWMDRPLTVVSVAVFVLGLTVLSITRLGTAFLPTLEENNIWLRVTLPNTVDLDYSVKVANQLRETFLRQPEIDKVAAQIGRPDDGTDSTGVFNQEYGLYLKSPDKMPSGSSKKELIAHLEQELNKIPGVTYSFSQYIQDNVNEALSGVKGENSVKIYGTDLEVLDQKAHEVIEQLKKVRGVADEGILKELGQPTLNIQIDRERAARYGINVNDIQTVVANAIGGAAVTNLLEDEKTFGIAIRLNEGSRNDIADIGHLLVDSPNSAAIPLSMVATVQLSDGPFFIYREAGKRYIAIKFSVRNRDLGSAVEDAQFLVEKNITLPPNYSISWDGQFNQMKQAQKKLMLIVPLALLGIFLLLVSAFGNFRDAVIVMINVPFAAIGGVIALHLAGETLSISAFFGFLSLFGIAIQDGVILISFINKTAANEHGEMKDVMVEGASLRVRPVLMTAALSGLGLLPAALSHSIGSEAQRPLALVIVGGMVTTTILTLLVLPVIYGWFRGRSLSQTAKA